MSGHLIDEIGINPIETAPRYEFFSKGEKKGAGNSVDFALYLIQTCGGVEKLVYCNESWEKHHTVEDNWWWNQVCKGI
tara:strand:+ start:188 stop:421 length:234 start_codon:yes stop_codon:yes gene_type:complete